jgi:serine/threonine protein kinase
MPLSPGMHLGPYQIISTIGAGGMGEVYRAIDTRLERTVAIKILSSHLSSNADLKRRFEREAKTISSLSHPHICALYDIGHQDGIDYLVMEFIEGETLSQRLNKGALSTDLLLRYGIQIADALDKAHRQGIIHRDLKPGNIMLTKSGAKLLDFGLAKLEQAAAQPILPEVSALPTERHDLTAEGTILGTIQYMSPEQLEGKEADARTDIFALGLVLYEMATGKKAFAGKSQASLIAAILSSEPASISSVQPTTPPALDRVVKTCLAKDPDDRWQTAHDVMIELKWIGEAASQPVISGVATTQRRSRERLAWILATLFFSLWLGALLFMIPRFRQTDSRAIMGRFEVSAPEKAKLSYSLAISPDGRFLTFVADTENKRLLWLRRLDSTEAKPLSGTEGALFPFWSPDSRFIGFFAHGKLKKIDTTGGSPQTLCDVSAEPRGGTWNQKDVILFAPGAGASLYQVSAAGGKPSPITKLDESRNESTHRWPHFLPDGIHFVYFVRTFLHEDEGIYIGSLDSTEHKRLFPSASGAVYSRSGYLLFVRDQTLMAQHFSASDLRLEGGAFVVAESVEAIKESGPTGYSAVSVSENDILVYKSGHLNAITRLEWLDRKGAKLESIGPTGIVDEPSLSPDGKRIAFNYEDPKTGDRYIWLLDANRGILSRLTFHESGSSVWSPDGNRIAFASTQKSTFPDLYWKLSNGAGDDEPLLELGVPAWPDDWSRDGNYLVYETDDLKTKSDLWVLPMKGDHKPAVFLKTEYNESQAQISPDVRWIAYASDESGEPEVYVRTFPAKGGKWQISSGGGSMPAWRADGKELFYLSTDKNLVAVPVHPGANFEPGIPQTLFKVNFRRIDLGWNKQYIAPDGQRFLVNTVLAESSDTPITVVTNWTIEHER